MAPLYFPALKRRAKKAGSVETNPGKLSFVSVETEVSVSRKTNKKAIVARMYLV